MVKERQGNRPARHLLCYLSRVCVHVWDAVAVWLQSLAHASHAYLGPVARSFSPIFTISSGSSAGKSKSPAGTSPVPPLRSLFALSCAEKFETRDAGTRFFPATEPCLSHPFAPVAHYVVCVCVFPFFPFPGGVKRHWPPVLHFTFLHYLFGYPGW